MGLRGTIGGVLDKFDQLVGVRKDGGCWLNLEVL